MKRIASLLAGSLLWASTSHAFGVDVTWNDCATGTAGTAVSNMFFQCTGTSDIDYDLYLQYKSPVDVPGFVAVTYYMDLLNYYDLTPLAPYWHYENGGCNRSSLSISAAVPASCSGGGYISPFGADGSSGTHAIATYIANYQRPGRGHLLLLSARGDAFPLLAGANYFGMRVRLSNRNRATCAGCNQEKGVFLHVARLESNDGSMAVDLSGADKFNYHVCINTINCVPPDAATPVSWGRLKSMFR